MAKDGVTGFEGLLSTEFRAPHAVLPMPKPGEVFAERYQIERLIGQGGMGDVYLARQSPLQRRVALKILKPPQTIEDDPNFDARFLREAAAAARLQHPNTITVYDFGQTQEGQLYIVMEYLEGTDVRTSLAHDVCFGPRRAIHVAKQVCKSLREAHSKGIIHRDLKPANVLLVERDDDVDYVKVLDFGLVKFRGEATEITLAGKFLGSPRYTSPESLDRNAVVDHRADIYAVGILLYTMLAGTPPFDGDPMQVLNAHLHEIPKPVYKMNPTAQTTPELEAVITKCLEKRPADRYDSMAEVLEALREVGAYFGDEQTETLDLELSDSGVGSRKGSPKRRELVPGGLSSPASPDSGKHVIPSPKGLEADPATATVTRVVPEELLASQGPGSPHRVWLAVVSGVVVLLAFAVLLSQLDLGADEVVVPSGGAVLLAEPVPDLSMRRLVPLKVSTPRSGVEVSLEVSEGWEVLGKTPLETSVPLLEGVDSVRLRLLGADGLPVEHEVSLVDGRIVFGAASGTAAARVRRAAELRGPKTKPERPGKAGDSGSAGAARSGEQSDASNKDRPAEASKDEDLDLPAGYKDNPY